MRVNNKVMVVTGAGSGIGRAVALELLAREARVVAVDLRSEGLATLREEAASTDLFTITLDVTDRDAVRALPARVIDEFGVIDGIVNNAGIIQPFVKVLDLDDEAIDRVLDVNLRSQITMVQAFLPHLLDRREAHITNVSSMGAFLPVPGQVVYGASKAGVLLLTEGLYAELLGTPVGVSVVLPGGVATNITENSGVEVPAGADAADSPLPVTTPAAAARRIVDGIERNEFHVHVGKDSVAMHALQRLAPKQATKLITRQMASLLD